MQIIAKKAGKFGNQFAKKGEVVTTQPAYAKVWIALGLAESVDGPAAPVKRATLPAGDPPKSAFDRADAETDEERHARLLPEAAFQPGAEQNVAGNVGAMSTETVPVDGEVKTPEKEAPAPETPEPITSGSEEQPDPAVDEVKGLRSEYEVLYGKKPYMGWKADDLREKIAEKKAEA